MIDLDAKKAERLAENGEAQHSIRYHGIDFPLPPELEFDLLVAIEHANDNTTTLEVLRELLGERFDEFHAMRPSYQDVVELGKGIQGEYGLDSPEAEASSDS